MDIHKNARLTPHGRGELVRRVLVEGQTPKAVRKWVERFQSEGKIGLHDRSSRIEILRRERRPTSYIAKESGRFAGDRQPCSQAPRAIGAYRYDPQSAALVNRD